MTVTAGYTSAQLAAKLAGPGITIVTDSLTCDAQANGMFINSPITGDPIGIDSGIILSTGKALQTSGPEAGTTSTGFGLAGDADLLPLVGSTTTTFDACYLIVYLIPQGDTLSFNYQFGSEEYIHSTCGNYDDAFAFFIAGTGVSATYPGVNMALVPGTNIPVLVNTVNSGIVTSGYGTLSNCTSLGAGSPFTSYYIDNTGGAYLSYRGYTDVFRAFHSVTPCDTYRLKMSIVDAGNDIYDSGVFIEAGSLKTNTYHFDLSDSIGATIDGLPHTIVKGCSSTSVTVLGTYTLSTASTLNLSTGGTAVSGVDYSVLPTTLSIPGGDTSVSFTVTPLATGTTGPKTLILYLTSTIGCGNIDTLLINILDSPSASILTPDTSVCAGQTVDIRTTGTTGLTYSWTPASYLDSTNVPDPVATPTSTIIYTMTASLPGSGCPAIINTIQINMDSIWAQILTTDTSICPGQMVNIMTAGSAGLSYTWSPGTFLNSTTLADPTATPTSTITYTMTAGLPGSSCTPIVQSITITMNGLSATINTPDTTICAGNFVDIQVTGSAALSYNWSPAASLSSNTVINPVATPHSTTTYNLTVTSPGSTCPPINESVTITVDSAWLAILTSDTSVCAGNIFQIITTGAPGMNYTWTPATYLSSNIAQSPYCTPAASQTYVVSGSDGVCPPVSQSFNVNVVTVTVSITNPPATPICPNTPYTIYTTGSPADLIYNWTPAATLDNPAIADPTATTADTSTYFLTATDPVSGCFDTASVTIDIYSPFKLGTKTVNSCIGNNLTLNVSTDPQPLSNFSFTWYAPDTLTYTGANPALNNVTELNSGIYTVTATDIATGCSQSATEAVSISAGAGNDIVIIPQIHICQYTQAQPLYISEYKDLVWYQDSLAPDSAYSLPPPIPNTNVAGTVIYYAKQLVGICLGNFHEIPVTIAPCCDGVIFIPDAFTPAGTENKLFNIIAPDFTIQEFRIFNRWGQQVFESVTNSNGWDGTFNGVPQDMGTYYYMVTAVCNNNDQQNQIIRSGSLTLIR